MQNNDDDSLIAASVASSQQSGRGGGGDGGSSRLPPYTTKSNNNNSNPSGSWSTSAFMPSVFRFSSSSSRPATTAAREDEKHDDSDELIDFTETFVTVHENDADEVDILLNGGDPGYAGHNIPEEDPPLDALAVLLSAPTTTHSNHNNTDSPERMVSLSEQATIEMNRAVTETKNGNMQQAMDAHSAAARLFHQAAVELREKNASMAESFLLLSQTEAKSALGLKRIMKVRPHGVNVRDNDSNKSNAHKERIRETVRGALDKQQPQEDLSESVFLGRATKGPYQPPPPPNPQRSNHATDSNHLNNNTAGSQSNNDNVANPIDEMMKLERDLREMDMALEMGNSIASLDTKSRMKTMDGSFMVVPPGSQSYMSSSMVLAAQTPQQQQQPQRSSAASNSNNRPVEIIGAAGARARANRVQSISAASGAHPQSRPSIQQPTPAAATVTTPIVAPAPRSGNGLESSWWGGASTTASASQVLSSSVISLASNAGSVPGGGGGGNDPQQPANNKQLMQLMDSLKRLGDENAALLREVQQAEAARAEAKAARQEMRRFQQEYNKRFEILKATLDKFRKGCEQSGNGATATTKNNPVTTSEFLIAQTTSEQLARQEQLIRKLTADLKREKEDAKKKEVIFRRYESFYREVKAMSAQKAAQRKKEQQQSKNRISHSQSTAAGLKS